MTLVVAVKATDAIIIGADSRGTIGDPRGITAINDTQQKLFPFGRCALAIAGASDLALALLDEFNRRGLANPQNIDEGVSAFAQGAVICDGWFRNIAANQRPGAIFTVAGYRTVGNLNTPMVYMMSSQAHFAPQLQGNYPAMAGVPQYALYLAHRYYSPAITGDSAAALAEYLISETASQDPKVGGPIRIAKVTALSGYEELTTSQVGDLRTRNQKLNDELKGFFINGGKA